MSFITKKWKLVSLILLAAFCVLVWIGFSANRQGGELAAFNRLQEDFYDEYLTLQEERVRVAAIAHNGAGHDEIINQLEIMHEQAEKTYEVMIKMHETASRIEIVEEEDEVSIFVTSVYAGSFQDFGKNVIWNLPLVGRLAHGFDTTTDSIRLGLYKAYNSGIVGDQEILDELMRKKDIKTREELLTAPPEDITWVFSHARSTEASPTINNEVNLAEVAVKGGVAAVKAYFDGVLLVTGGKSIDVQSELLNQLGVSSDLQSFVKMGLGDATGGEYLKDKAKEQFLELYEYVLTPEEITAIVEQDSEEIKAILARAKGIEEEENKSTKTLLALSQTALNLSKQVVKNSDIDENLPYHEWSLEAQRELAQKLNVEEEKGPLMISAKTKSGGITQYLLPSGMWDILTSSKGTMPRYTYDVNKENGKTGSMISLTTRLANAKKAQTLIEQESLTYEKLEELGLLTSEDIAVLNSQNEKKSAGISKLLQPLRNLLQYRQRSDVNKQDVVNKYDESNGDDSDSNYVPDTATNNDTCIENWICEEWDPCADGTQNRVCSDHNKCGSVLKNGRPIRTIETQSCQNSSGNQSGGSNCSGDGSLLDQVCRGDRPQESLGDWGRVDTSLLDEE